MNLVEDPVAIADPKIGVHQPVQPLLPPETASHSVSLYVVSLEVVRRRDKLRYPPLYPITLDLHYKVLSGATPVQAGSGRTTRFGSRRVVFTAEPALQVAARLQVSIAWPVLLDDRVKLQLVIEGRVIGVDGDRVTLGVVKHHFRTRGPAIAANSLEPCARPMPVIPITGAAHPKVALRAHV
jgi:hypothetical protein